jgi:hypothetical protein
MCGGEFLYGGITLADLLVQFHNVDSKHTVKQKAFLSSHCSIHKRQLTTCGNCLDYSFCVGISLGEGQGLVYGGRSGQPV